MRQTFSRREDGVSGKTPALVAGALLLSLTAVIPANAVEHPGILHKDDNCLSCHADKTRGKSVHSVMASACTVCHLAQTQGDMTTLSLAMPKEQICFACHEKSTELQQHSPAVKALCVQCHDAHSSNRRMLLREQVDVRRRNGTGQP
jgi:predicted CXXCH cytochrome family protein